MAQYYGNIVGNRGTAHRLGTKSSGIEGWTASWDGAIVTRMYWEPETEVNRFVISMKPWHGAGPDRFLLNGVVGESRVD